MSAKLYSLITEKIDEIKLVDTASMYLKLGDRINETIKYFQQVDAKLLNEYKVQNKDIYVEVANTHVLDNIFKKDETSIELGKKYLTFTMSYKNRRIHFQKILKMKPRWGFKRKIPFYSLPFN